MSSEETEYFDLQRTIDAVAGQLGAGAKQVRGAVALLDDGNTIPFIARYRKEATGGLDEIALRAIEDALTAARELAARKRTVLESIERQGELNEELKRQVLACEDKASLETLYLPYKPRRRTRATAARERGLGPLADLLLAGQPLGRSKQQTLKAFVDPEKDVPDSQAALQGALDIVAEIWSEKPDIRRWMLDQAMAHGQLVSKVKRGKKAEASKFEQYADHRESVRRVPSHRLLAMKRGEAEGILKVSVQLDEQRTVRTLRAKLVGDRNFEFHRELNELVDDCYQRLLMPATESAVMQQLKERADEEAIAVFGKNLRELLLAPPAGPKVTLGIDPGFRTGCKLAVVDGTGKFLASATIYPTPPRKDTASAEKTLDDLAERFGIEMIAIGNGTASRETDHFISDWLRRSGKSITQAMVSESGASIYSASELAAREYPNLDVTVRGAISIAHRLQDPLAELVKTDPKSIGVGQYQHDVNQAQLKKRLEREVESCVNSVGVDVNLASAPLLSHVAGIGPKLAERIVEHREQRGRYHRRDELLKVPKLGKKAYQQAAGFLRIPEGEQPLDNSAVHPESYPVVEKMAAALGTGTRQLVGNAGLAEKLQPQKFVDDRFGLPTITDILAELAKPGRDPRREFRTANFAEGVEKIDDVRAGMVLEGVITNVTHFGAFIDLGVHQDGLIHISQLADHYVADPGEVVSVGDVVRVKVLEVDVPRKRISVSRKELSG